MQFSRSNGKSPIQLLGLGLGLALVCFTAAFRGPRNRFWQRMTLTGLTLGSFSLFARPRMRRTSIGLGELLQGLASAGILYVIFQAGDRFARRILPGGGQQIDQIYSLDRLGSRNELMARLSLVIAPAEELFWRGFVQNDLMGRFGRFWGTVLGVASYGGVHLTSGNLTLIAAATVAGGFWGGLYARGMPLGALIVSHIVWDNLIFLISPTSRSRPDDTSGHSAKSQT